MFNGGEDIIVFYVGAQHWMSFLDNYGTGSKMDTSNNPWLQDYIESDFFNKDRLNHGMAVIGRGDGEYLAPDFKVGSGTTVRNSSGGQEGVNL